MLAPPGYFDLTKPADLLESLNMVFERRHEPLLPRRLFIRRMMWGLLIAAIMVAGSLVIGIVGYHWLGHLGWVDSLLNASFILTGMGPVNNMTGTAAKLFASAYALFSGVVFITSIGILLAPAAHRMLHRFHLESGKGRED